MIFPHTQVLRVTSDEIDSIIDDLRLMREGAAVLIAVDPAEVFQFSYPIDVRETKRIDIQTISDDQIAYFYVFFQHYIKPILLPEYEAEMEGLAQFLDTTIKEVERKDFRFDLLLAAAGGSPLATQLKLSAYWIIFRSITMSFWLLR